MNDLQLWALRLNSSKDMTFEISELEMLTIQKVGGIMSSLVQLSHMRIVKRYIGVQVYPSGFIRRVFSFIFPCDLLYTLCLV